MKHGGDLTQAMARHGGAPSLWLDLSTGINPWVWPIPDIVADAWQRLPSHADHAALIDAARAAYVVPADVDIVAASGTQALIQWLPHLAAPGAVAVVGPTYHEHEAAWRDAGREVRTIGSLDQIPDGVRHVVIVNPNNPDGRVADLANLARAAETLRGRGGWLVIDEAFADVDPAISAATLCPDLPIVILRSFGKFYGLAGVRLGFAIAAPQMVSRIAAAIGPWACSGPALQIGAAALLDVDWAEAMRDALSRQAGRLDAVLIKRGCELVGGTSLYRLVRCRDARGLHEALARRQIWCRRFDWAEDLLRFGLPPDDVGLDRLAAALA
ncbi:MULTISPECIES: threonine-phosphate decarboxylase CobD [Rhodopseudomonas]|uniref:threonine-phosphate decarboxylase n=1 Tax=Rhodopseudomonas palustris TaxID=1076 RepID=A0A0D7E9C9_RHOPL|nr:MULTISPECIES: threonine-phosphate decarboxylase CobD [Rhodopseudomonas]KIZ36167.1 alpha-ribazole phosphatase [Rhodopseudomonas palustris]MDF3812157.1 threonine-phosphate decarboxylase CobD [Rhodopseudomonas sp. BAL398]WOK16547.1 threonine-phosphate decarboxylase CobD [Rhodopseudomonas sp. BAL398]